MILPARWFLPEEAAGAPELAAAAGLSPPAARVLWHRGYRDPNAVRGFLGPRIEDLHDPMLLLGMGAAVERLRRAVAGGEKILLYGDYDVDGTTSVVLLKKVLEMSGAGVSFHVPDRLKEGYGMRTEVVERAAAAGVGLILSVDTGIRASEVVRRAGELAIDVIVTDHHLPEAQLPPALAVLNPNQPGCPYPEKNLCGAGVAFKLAQALLAASGMAEAKTHRILGSLLKLVAIATVADVVPLTGENRVIVRHGLAGLAEVRNPGLRALLDTAGIAAGAVPTAHQVAFRIAPRINAAGRMATARDVIELFLTDSVDRARLIAGQLHALNQERQQAEAAMLAAALEECEREPVTDAQAALVFAGEGWHRGVVGIVASRLVDRFHRPVFVLSLDTRTGEAHGSGRGIPEFHLLEALESMPEMFTRFGGHRQAAGLVLPVERVQEFRRRFNEHALGRLEPGNLRPRVNIDAIVDLSEINDRAVQDIFALEPFGYGNPTPVFAVLGVEVREPPFVWKEKHLRLRLWQNGRGLFVKAWRFAERAGEFVPGARLDAALSFEEDSFAGGSGAAGWSATLRDVRPS